MHCPSLPLMKPRSDTLTTYKLFVHHSRVDIRKHFICNRIVKVWNSLPAAADDFATVRSFTRLIEQVDL